MSNVNNERRISVQRTVGQTDFVSDVLGLSRHLLDKESVETAEWVGNFVGAVVEQVKGNKRYFESGEYQTMRMDEAVYRNMVGEDDGEETVLIAALKRFINERATNCITAGDTICKADVLLELYRIVMPEVVMVWEAYNQTTAMNEGSPVYKFGKYTVDGLNDDDVISAIYSARFAGLDAGVLLYNPDEIGRDGKIDYEKMKRKWRKDYKRGKDIGLSFGEAAYVFFQLGREDQAKQLLETAVNNIEAKKVVL